MSCTNPCLSPRLSFPSTIIALGLYVTEFQVYAVHFFYVEAPVGIIWLAYVLHTAGVDKRVRTQYELIPLQSVVSQLNHI